MLEVYNSAELAILPLSQNVPWLVDRRRNLASESSFYRLLRANERSVTEDGPTNGPAHALGGSQGQYALKGQLHSAIRFVTPAARHAGHDRAPLANRANVRRLTQDSQGVRVCHTQRMRRSDICLYLGPADRAELQALIAKRNTPRKLV